MEGTGWYVEKVEHSFFLKPGLNSRI